MNTVAPTSLPPRPLPRWISRTGWLLILVVGIAAYVVILNVMVSTRNINFFPSLLLVGAATVPLATLFFAEPVRQVTRLSGWTVVATAVGGSVVGTVTAGVLEYDTLRDLGAMPMIFVGVIEESAKLIVPVIVFLILRNKDIRGGVVIGVASGAGFAILETMGYGFQALLAHGDVTQVDSTLLLRGLLSPACHIAWTGMTTAALWHIGTRGGVLRFVGVFILAVALHALWDGSTDILVHLAIALIGYVTVLVLINRSGRGRFGAAAS